MTGQDLFEHSFVLTVDEQRLNRFVKIFLAAGLQVPEVFHGYADKSLPGAKCAGISHSMMIKEAKTRKIPWILMFEDDAYPRSDIRERMKTSVPTVNDTTWLGFNVCSAKARGWSTLPHGGQLYGSHAYVVWSRAYDKILDMYASKKPGELWCDRICDRMYGNRCSASVPEESWFTTYTDKPSNFNNVGYLWGVHGKPCPPPGYLPVEHYIPTPTPAGIS